MRGLIRFLIGLFACCALAYSVYMMCTDFTEAAASSDLNTSLAESAVSTRGAAPEDGEDAEEDSAEETASVETAPIAVDFAALKEVSQDVVAWLYLEDTPINLPVAQAEDNDYYLRRLLDGSDNGAGTLFADCRASGDFSDKNTVIYGHNMKNKTMFGTLSQFGEQEYCDAHSVLWLLTPNADYKLEPVAGFVTSSTAEVYTVNPTEEEMDAILSAALEKSTFTAELTLSDTDRYLTLSTCSYEFENARYVLICRMTEVG